MAKMYFAKRVKYLGTTYPANAAIEVKEEDIQDLKNAGGWLMEKSEEPKDPDGGQNEDTNPEADPEGQAPAESHEDEDWTLDELKEIAASLGIEVKGNWGIKKLKEVIAEAQK